MRVRLIASIRRYQHETPPMALAAVGLDAGGGGRVGGWIMESNVMDDSTATAMMLAQAQYRKEIDFRRYVDAAVNEAMRHAEHFESEVNRRDLHHIAVVAAMATLRFAMDGDHRLKTLEAERDHYRKLAEEALRISPRPTIFANNLA